MHPSCWNYTHIEYARKAYQNAERNCKEQYFQYLQFMEAMKDYFNESIDEIKYLKQLDQIPNLDLKESKWELYKISISFTSEGKVSAEI